MSTVQISPNSVLMNPSDINPLAHPAYQNAGHKVKELNNKALEQTKTDTVTISREAVAKSLETKVSGETSEKKASDEIKAASQAARLQLITSAEAVGKDDSASVFDPVTISSEAMLKSSTFNVLPEGSYNSKPESAYEKLMPY